jgi:hypothetical protein
VLNHLRRGSGYRLIPLLEREPRCSGEQEDDGHQKQDRPAHGRQLPAVDGFLGHTKRNRGNRRERAGRSFGAPAQLIDSGRPVSQVVNVADVRTLIEGIEYRLRDGRVVARRIAMRVGSHPREAAGGERDQHVLRPAVHDEFADLPGHPCRRCRCWRGEQHHFTRREHAPEDLFAKAFVAEQ